MNEIIVIDKRVGIERDKTRVAAYCRVSTDQPGQEESFDTQVQYYQKMISQNPRWEFAGVYADKGVSGTSAEHRPEFMRLMEDAFAGHIDIIFTKSISRFARNVVDCQTYTRKLKELGVEVRFEREQISNMDPTADFIFSILSAIAQEESHSLSENMRWRYKQNFMKGIYRLGNNRILGYDMDEDGKLIPNLGAWIVSHVKDHQCNAGFAFDGDADRCLAVDEHGNIVDGDRILYICSRHMKETGALGNSKVVTTIMSNLGLYQALDAIGIDYEKTAVGDRFVYENMKANGHLIGGEQSGHIIFGKLANTGDGLLTAIKIMEVMLDKKAALSELAKPMKIFPQVLRNIHVTDKDLAMNHPEVQAICKQVSNQLSSNGRVLLRKSGTEPVLRVLIEAPAEEICVESAECIIAAITKAGLIA